MLVLCAEILRHKIGKIQVFIQVYIRERADLLCNPIVLLSWQKDRLGASIIQSCQPKRSDHLLGHRIAWGKKRSYAALQETVTTATQQPLSMKAVATGVKPTLLLPVWLGLYAPRLAYRRQHLYPIYEITLPLVAVYILPILI